MFIQYAFYTSTKRNLNESLFTCDGECHVIVGKFRGSRIDSPLLNFHQHSLVILNRIGLSQILDSTSPKIDH